MSLGNRRRWWSWLWLTTVTASGTGLTVAAAVWAQTPSVQLPLLVLTLWLGPVLPLLLQWSWHRAPGFRWGRSRRTPVTFGKPVARWTLHRSDLENRGMTMWTGFLLSTGIAMLPPVLAILDRVFPSDFLWSEATQDFRIPDFVLWVLGPVYLIFGVYHFGYHRQPFYALLYIDPEGLTVASPEGSVRLRWGAVDSLAIVHGCLVADSLTLEREPARRIGKHSLRRGVDWDAVARPRLLLCPLAAITGDTNAMLDRFERYWGQPVPRPALPGTYPRHGVPPAAAGSVASPAAADRLPSRRLR